MTPAFWQLASRHWPPVVPTASVIAACGDDGVAAMLAANLLQRRAVIDGDVWLCADCGGIAEIVEEEDALVAVCRDADGGCGTARVDACEQLAVEDGAFSVALARLFGLTGPLTGGPIRSLGSRLVGVEGVEYLLVGRPRDRGVVDALYRRCAGGLAIRVVLVPAASAIPADGPARIGNVEVLWVGLDQLLVLRNGAVVVDHAPLLRLRPFSGVDAGTLLAPAWPLVVEGEQAWWGGKELAMAHTAAARRLLVELAASPSIFLSRRHLWAALYPDDHTRDGRVARGVNPDELDARLRGAVRDLRAVFAACDGGSAIPVETQRSVDGAGGYRLAIQPGSVWRAVPA